MKDIDEFIAEGQIYGEVGIAIDMETKTEDLKIPFDDLDYLLLMSVKQENQGRLFFPKP